MRPKEPRKLTVIRCPQKLFDDIEQVCRQNRITRTRLINMALFTFAAQLGKEGELPPYPERELPPQPPKPRNYYL